ncbi:MAG: C39 family peptidase [Clostridia bacterium]|nr:C39 family peptidase [Clostridia bacterium]
MKNTENKPSNAVFTVLIITAILFFALGIGAIVFALNYPDLRGAREAETQTEITYETIPADATPIKKEIPEDEINYETPVNTPPLKLLDVPYINQGAKYPTGCESVSAVMALNFAGYEITPEDFIDNFLPKSPAPYIDGSGRLLGYHPSHYFLGNPYSKDGWGCYYPVIARCLNRIIDSDRHEVVNLHNAPLEELVSYVDGGTPVIMWVTQGMNKPRKSQTWTLVDSGASFTWVSPNHCLLLVGYDETGYYFNDPLTHKNCRYPADIVAKRYKSMGRQALTIVSID